MRLGVGRSLNLIVIACIDRFYDLFSPGGVELPCKSDGDAHQKIKTKPLRKTNVGVAQA